MDVRLNQRIPSHDLFLTSIPCNVRTKATRNRCPKVRLFCVSPAVRPGLAAPVTGRVVLSCVLLYIFIPNLFINSSKPGATTSQGHAEMPVRQLFATTLGFSREVLKSKAIAISSPIYRFIARYTARSLSNQGRLFARLFAAPLSRNICSYSAKGSTFIPLIDVTKSTGSWRNGIIVLITSSPGCCHLPLSINWISSSGIINPFRVTGPLFIICTLTE